jgi:PhoPQ-activated pathogenicity-related protein
MSLEKYKLKLQGASISKNPEHWQHEMLAKVYSNKNSHSFLIKIQNGTTTLEDNLAVSYKPKSTLTIRSSNLAT